jgi:hypothetical protein
MQLGGWETVLGANLDDLSVLSGLVARPAAHIFASGEFEVKAELVCDCRSKRSLRAWRGLLSG